ncbi:YiiX/YebB-like N1pC/P60 family cysteine hydrolase [Pseudomonas chlororaphis subsp. aurantiaca]|uniref:YiiX/YebB-like N1pC/P60 family cysteine hydrolase n=1 Tax=Pseudomonas chlororaphis TaxID=587753 RepID=UPI0027DDD393|nr:YiiX/YebB-like N1pC/P60 family cysteine hydrolase [Pseudomonas chlororaphis]WMI99980.1 YiiX/YebB-like N1pC/P60 family cysteine hydrolase [Pseudomonas chlororaphis subsp. aurantiaca]
MIAGRWARLDFKEKARESMVYAGDLQRAFTRLSDAPELLNGQELLAGDVLFCGQPQDNGCKLTEVIQNTTDGVYVHCGVYIGDGVVVDAVASGIREIPLEQFVSNYTYVAVTRCPGTNEKRSEAITQFAHRCVGLRYNRRGAAMVPLREYLNIRWHYNLHKIRHERPFGKSQRIRAVGNGYFCSEFVVQCYIECGYIPGEERYYDARCWSPTGLAEDRFFELIGFMSDGGLEAVHPDDPYLAGNAWVLTPEGQRLLKERKKWMEKQIEAYLLQMPQSEDA